jgi:hypothetical protein
MRSGFRYPDSPHRWRHGPQGYADYDSYRPWLRDEFDYRCVFCLIREQWGRVSGEFELDHYVPLSLRPDGAADYDNLRYACRACNTAKGSRLIPDPTAVLTAREIVVHDDGSVEGISEAADRLILVLDLNDVEYCRWRRTWLRIIDLAERYDRALYNQLLGFPDDLPDLARLRPPGGNSRPEGIRESSLAKRERGELPLAY